MIAIDTVIHSWHWETRQERQLGRPVGVNLIAGSRKQVLALLDALSYGAGSVTGAPETYAAWLASWQRVKAAQRRRE